MVNLSAGEAPISDAPDLVFSAASLIDLPIAGAAYQQVATGQWRTSDTFTLQQSNKVGGNGILQTQPNGTTYTLEQLVEIMLLYSDNTAANMLVDRLGGFDRVNAFSAANGMTATTMRRKLFDLAAQQRGIDNTTTAGDMGRFFTRLYEGRIVNATTSQRLLAVLRQRGQADREWSLLNLPQTIIAAHIIGTGEGMRNDIALISSGGRDYLIVLMVRDPNEAAMEAAIARVASEIYNLLNSR